MKLKITAIVACLAGALALLGPPGEAGADMGGATQVRIHDVKAQPDGAGGWHLSVSLVNIGSGAPVRTMEVNVTGSGPGGAAIGPVILDDLGDGRYESHFAAAPAGQWNVGVSVRPRPGGEPAVPVQQAFNLQVAEGEAAPADSAAATGSDAESGGSGGGSGAVVAVVAIVAAMCAVGGGLIVKSRRRAGAVAA